MTHEPPSSTDKPRLDDLLATMGITREQLKEMTADDLFAAATQWQNAATVAGTESLVIPTEHITGNRVLQRPGELAV